MSTPAIKHITIGGDAIDDRLFNAIQNKFDLYDNCVMKYSDDEPKVIVIEGHRPKQVYDFTDTLADYLKEYFGDKRLDATPLEIKTKSVNRDESIIDLGDYNHSEYGPLHVSESFLEEAA